MKQLNVFAFDGKRISSDKKFKFNLLSDKMNGYVRETHNWNTFELSWYDMTCRRKYCTSCILLFLNENKYFEFMKSISIKDFVREKKSATEKKKEQQKLWTWNWTPNLLNLNVG